MTFRLLTDHFIRHVFIATYNVAHADSDISSFFEKEKIQKQKYSSSFKTKPTLIKVRQ